MDFSEKHDCNVSKAVAVLWNCKNIPSVRTHTLVSVSVSTGIVVLVGYIAKLLKGGAAKGYIPID